MDFIMTFFLCHNIIQKKLELSTHTALLAIASGLSTGILSYYLDVSLYKFVATTVMFCVIGYITKKAIHEILIVYEIIFLCVGFIQLVLLMLLENLPIEQSYLYLLIQTLILVCIILVYVKIPLYKLFNMIQKQVLLQLMFFIGTIVLLSVYAYFDYGYTSVKTNILYILVLIIAALLGCYRSLKNVFFYTNRVPTQLHDVKNILMGLYVAAHSTEDIEIIRQELNKSLEIIGIDMPMEDVQVNEHKNNILVFINQIRDKYHSQVEINSDIEFYEDNTNITRSVILYMLGVLLDNAIESGTKKDIYIKIRIDTNYLLVSVANEHERKSIDDFDKMFQERYSTKSRQLSGYGLPNLSRVVEKHGGEIQVEYTYNTQQVSNYLKLSIEIKK